MIGILCEKPSAARNFATALGGVQGTYNGEKYVIVAARGHLYEYLDPDKMVPSALAAQYKSWELQYLPWDETQFNWTRVQKKDVVKGKGKSIADTLKDIKTVLDKCDEVVIATDVDPTGEGELLAWEILDEQNIKPAKFSRMYFMDESPKSIQDAFVKRKVLPDMRQDMDFIKAEYRAQWDMLSMQWTRIATFCVGGGAVIRQGRLKSVMVNMVGKQLAAYNDYKKIPEYVNKFRDENNVVYTNPEEPRFKNKEEVPNIYKPSTVTCDSKTMKSTAPPKLIDLASLSAKLSTSGVSAKEVLNTYQKMYEAKVVSYPRTEDKVITPEQFNDLLPLVDKIAGVVGVDTSLLTHRTPRSTHVKTGGAHGANRPGPNVPKKLDDLVQYGSCAPMIYEILAKNYLAMLAEDYEYEQQKGHVTDYPKFVGTASVPKSMGWKLVFNDADDEDVDESSLGLGQNADPFVAEIINPRPAYPTMKWLMKQLEKNDVGTGATRTSTYADVTNAKSKYPLLLEKKGKLFMTDFGSMSYILLEDTKIGDVQVTESLMQEMREIAEGKLNPADCLHNVQDMIKYDMKIMLANRSKLKEQLGEDVMKQAEAANGAPKEKYAGVWSETGKQVSFTRQWSTHYFTDDECERLLAGEDIEITDLVSKAGKPYAIHGKLTNQSFKGHKFVGFENLGFVSSGSSNKGVPDEWQEHRFTEDEKTMLEMGKEIYIEGCVSKKGSVYNCYVSYGKNDKGYMAIIPNFNR